MTLSGLFVPGKRGMYMILDYSQNGITAVFEITEQNFVILRRFADEGAKDLPHRKDSLRERWRAIADVQIAGEDINDHHAAKHTGTSGAFSLRYVTHRYYANEKGNKLEFDLADSRMQVTVHYQFYTGVSAVRAWTVVTNTAQEPLGLEYLTSFAYTGFDEGARTPTENLTVFVPHNSWCRECDWKEKSLSACGMQSHIGGFSLNRINVCNTGFWSTKEYLPMGAVRNAESSNTLMWQIEANGSWQWEIGDIGNMMYLKLSGPTEQESHWYKELKTGESFESVKTAVTVGLDLNDVLAQMTAYRRRIVRLAPPNRKMPVIFNDYLNCLGAKPTEENQIPLIDRAAELGAEYYCMDAGWYAGLDGTWWDRVGEWMPSSERFPHGIRAVFDYARSKGLVPGIWLELEVVGVNCEIAKAMPDECFVMRHGKRVIDHGRYILDFRSELVRAHVTEAFERVINEYGVGYIKTDYNVEAGIGTELDADSCGDGALALNRAFKAWCDGMREKYPDVIIENCASGGMRMDYLMLDNRDLQSLTDQTRHLPTATIAAAASTAVLPEQAAVWVAPRIDADADAVAFGMTSALLQRIHLSGKVLELSEDKLDLLKEGVACYKSYRDEISEAEPFYPLGRIPSYDEKWLCSAYRYPTCSRMTVWRLDADSDTLFVPTACDSVRILYPSNTKCTVTKEDGGINVKLPKPNTAVLLELR